MKHFKDNSRDSHSKSPPGRTTIQNILLCCLTLLAISCEKFITDEPVAQPPTLKTLKTSSNPVENTLSIIPADISQFNLLAQTKSALDTAQSGNRKSMLLNIEQLWPSSLQWFHFNCKIILHNRGISSERNLKKIHCNNAAKILPGLFQRKMHLLGKAKLLGPYNIFRHNGQIPKNRALQKRPYT